MKFKKSIIFVLIAVFAVFSAYMTVEFLKIPDKFIVMEGEKAQYGRFFSAHIKDASDEGILKNGVYTGKNDGKSFDADIKMMGILDVKRAEVEVVKNKKLIACGNAIGVKLYTDGVLVADLTEFEQKDGGNVSPARGAGLKPGDFITYAGGEKITDVKGLKVQTEKHKNKKMKIKFLRNSKERETEIEPKQEKNGGVWRLGFWAKDSTAGIGTLTYFDPETNTFGALGHGISGGDGANVLSVKNGSVVRANIIDVKKGVSGSPGELQGVFAGGNSKIGTIGKNIKYGIFGTADKENIRGEEYFVGTADKITEGKAYILSNISGDTTEKYEIEILKVMRYNENSTKGMVIKVTDKRLLEKTGGIVQGMSGSPIIQNDLLIGAVTHVFVNDPTKGYGIFMETMVKNSQ